LFLISVATLALQVLQTRILSVQMWHHHSYMVVTMTLLGFAAAGSLATIFPRLVEHRPARNASIAASLFALLTLVGFVLLDLTADRAAELTAQGRYLALSLFYSYLLLPYICAGLAVTIPLSAGPGIPRLYFMNLLGSALGAWVFIGLITPLGAERLMVLCALLGPVAGLAFAAGRRAGEPRGAARFALLALAVCAVAFYEAPRWFPIQVASNKAMADVLRRIPGSKHEDQVWSSLCRLDLVSIPDIDGRPQPKQIYQDGDAITVLHSNESFKVLDVTEPVALNQLAYEPQKIRVARGERAPRALAIGIGGGIDLRYGMKHGAESVLGIEINPVTVGRMRGPWSEFSDGVYSQPGIEVRLGEGRSTLRRLDQIYDVIELSGTDTYTAGNAGAYVLSESYLYTREALREYFEHLDPERGTLGMIRLAYDPPRENLRLFAIAMTVLRDHFGVKDVRRHAAVIFQEFEYPETGEIIRFAGNVYSRQPLDDEMRAMFGQAELNPVWRLKYLDGYTGPDNPFAQLAEAINAGTEEQFFDSYPYDVRPVSDDSPFFFNFHHWGDLFGSSKIKAKTWHELTGGPIGLKILFSLIVQTTVLVALLVLLPLLVLKRSGLRSENAGRHLVYFLGLGAGFMFLEISTMQRLVLYLGHPTYSLTVVMSCFMLFAGLGSLFAGRFTGQATRAMRLAIGLLCVLLVVATFAMDALLDATLALPFPVRVAVVVAMLAPLNFLMGMPFPLGLARLKQLSPRLVPWALGVNGGASVVASILCIVLAMESGFRVVSLLAALAYALAVLMATTGPLAPGRELPSAARES
jgi:hypothetical protein